ncbi:MAG: hypothetical protein NVSMB55_19050 [Mycobacteriales bacterium]
MLEPPRTSSLRRLDERFAVRGPLALLRDVPQLGLLVVAAVFLTGSGVALERSGSPDRATSAGNAAQASFPTILGPFPGTKIAAYLGATRMRAVLVSQAAPDRTYTALASFSRYLTADQTRLLLGDLEVLKVLAHVNLPGAEVLPIPVSSSLVADVDVTFAAVSKRKERDRKEFVNLAATITGDTKQERQFKAFYVDAARTSGLEAQAYGQSCPCVFAALVRGKARDLAALPALSGVRAVDIGDATGDTLQLQPLLPEQTVTVTRPVTPARGNGA